MPDRTIIQWDKNDLETLGLLKVDVLALGMLSALRRMLEHIREFGDDAIEYEDIRDLGYDEDADTRATYDMVRSEEHTSELQSLMRISYAVFCLKKNIPYTTTSTTPLNN